MEKKKRLNLDIASSISEFESFLKEFIIRKKFYNIVFRGKGLEFESYRDYIFDDDAKDIDWKASMRGNKLLIKQYIEERDLKIMIILDTGENMLFGSTDKLKAEYTAEVVAALSHLIVESGDKFGFVLSCKENRKILMPQGGSAQFNRFVDELEDIDNYGGSLNISETLSYLADYLDNSITAVFIVSDFIKVKQDALKNFNSFSNKFTTMAIMVKDPLDRKLPHVGGELVVEDPGSGEQIVIDPLIAGKAYEKNALEQENLVKKIFLDSGIDFLELTTDQKFAEHLAEFLEESIEKRRYVVAK